MEFQLTLLVNACLQFGWASSGSQKGGKCQRRSTTNSQATVSYRQRRLEPTVVVKVHVQESRWLINLLLVSRQTEPSSGNQHRQQCAYRILWDTLTVSQQNQ